MRNFLKQAVLTAFTVLLLVLAGHDSHAQEIPKADNSIHDRMYALMRKSDSVVLPNDVTEKINNININNPGKKKAIFTQTSILKVFYNKELSKNDILFFGNEILKSSSPSIVAISTDIKKLLTK